MQAGIVGCHGRALLKLAQQDVVPFQAALEVAADDRQASALLLAKRSQRVSDAPVYVADRVVVTALQEQLDDVFEVVTHMMLLQIPCKHPAIPNY
jgi:hypothetical protein